MASAKHELIIQNELNGVKIPINCNDFVNLIDRIDKTDKFVENNINLVENLKYLTIIASPNAIPQSFNEACNPDDFWYSLKQGVDQVYASSSNHFFESGAFDMAVDSKGIVHIVWSVQKDQRFTILYKTYNINTKTWEKEIELAPGFQYAYDPKIEIDNEDNVHILFRGEKIGEASFALFYLKLKSNTIGDIFEERSFIDKEGSPYYPLLVLGDDGEVHFFYTVNRKADNEKYVWDIRYTKLNDLSSIQTVATEDSINIESYRAVSDKNGIVYIVWVAPDIDWKYHIYSREINPNREMSAKKEFLDLTEVDGFVEYFGLGVDKGGELTSVVFIWERGVDGPNKYFGRIYSKGSWKKTEIPVEEMGEILDISIDKEDFIHILKSTVFWVGLFGFDTSYYTKIKLDGTSLQEHELVAIPFGDILGYSSNRGSLDIYYKDSLALPFAVIEVGPVVKNKEEGLVPGNYLPRYSLRTGSGWEISKEISQSFSKDYDMKFGRIYGITVSDTSSYIARVLSDTILSYSKGAGVAIGHDVEDSEETVSDITKKMQEEGYDWSCLTANPIEPCEDVIWKTDPTESKILPEHFQNKQVMTFMDHGTQLEWWKVMRYKRSCPECSTPECLECSILGIPELHQSLMLGDACSTSDFESGIEDTFGVWVLRKGGMSYMGASGYSWGWGIGGPERNRHYLDVLTDDLLKGKQDLGGVYKDISNEFEAFKVDYLLYGDPTYEVKLK